MSEETRKHSMSGMDGRSKESEISRINRLIFPLAVIGISTFFSTFFFGCHSQQSPPVLGKENVHVIQDVRYFQGSDKDARRHSLDIYLPTQGTNWPTAVVVHGGGWVVNDKSVVENLGYALANAGVAVVCPNYRLFPHTRHPAQVLDVARAVSWTRRNLAEYVADTDNFFLIGYSSGALLTALIALDARYLQAEGLDPNELRGVAVLSGIYEVNAVPMPLRLVFTHHREVWQEASPINHVRSDAPPFLILYAEHDLALTGSVSVEAQSHAFYKALKKIGVSVEIKEVANCNHDGIVEQVGRQPTSETLTFLLDFLPADGSDDDNDGG